jgi:hypothetical protein
MTYLIDELKLQIYQNVIILAGIFFDIIIVIPLPVSKCQPYFKCVDLLYHARR